MTNSWPKYPCEPPCSRRRSAISVLVKSSGVSPSPSFAFTSAPLAKCCFTASMFPSPAASQIEMSGADGPHPTKSTAAIVVSRRCFISLQLSILHPSCRRVCGEGRQDSRALASRPFHGLGEGGRKRFWKASIPISPRPRMCISSPVSEKSNRFSGL